jgi:ribosomal-protein-alanine N-acetyltransferase
MKRQECIETPRLCLRKPNRSDAAEILARYSGDPEVTKFLGWPRHRSLEDTIAFLSFSDDEWARWPAGPYLIESKNEARLLGSTGLSFETRKMAATGYVLAKDAWGRGYATEALGAMVDLAPKLGLEQIYAFCHQNHSGSARVLEKCGFRRDSAQGRPVQFPNLEPEAVQPSLCYIRTVGIGNGSWPWQHTLVVEG